jgi:hydroxyacylglutathione hydrolase
MYCSVAALAVPLVDNIEQKLFTLPDSCTVYPGHGPETTIGYEKQTNPFLT